MKKIMAGTLALSTVLTTAVFADSPQKPVTPELIKADITAVPIRADITPELISAEITPELINAEITPELINAEITTTTGVNQVGVARPLIGIQPVEIAETNNTVFTYIPKAVNDSMYVSQLDTVATDFGRPTNVWGLTYVNKEGKEAPIGTIEEYPKSMMENAEINTDLVDVFESEGYIYIATKDMGRRLYFPQSSVDSEVLNQYKDNLINFLDPYKIDASLSVQGINSMFAFSMPEGIIVNAYNTDTYNDEFLDSFTFYYNPMNRKDMPQEIMQIVSTTEQLSDDYMLLVEGPYSVYAKVNTESELTVEMDIQNYNDMVAILTDEDIMKNHTQLPQIEDVRTGLDRVLMIEGVDTGIEYKTVAEGRVVVPLRETFEQLGFEVTWNAETQSVDLTKGAIFTSVAIGEDNYTFGRRAGESLGVAPMLINGTTYVPVEFLSNILPYEVSRLANGQITINVAE